MGEAPLAQLRIPEVSLDLDGKTLVDRLTRTPLHECFLFEFYRLVGRYLDVKDLVARCGEEGERFEATVEDFIRGGLIERRGENDLFWRLPSREQWIAIEDWATRNGG